MALSTEQLMNMARHGAAAMIAELKTQIAEIERAFPSARAARRATGRIASGVSSSFSAGAKRRPRRARKMSAAQRKAVSVRMKKYWAARRAAKARTTRAKK